MASEVECTIDGMASIWDACPQIRERLRAGHPLISEVSDKCVDVKTPSTYHFVLEPLLEKMKDANKKLPSVDALRVEIAEVLTNNNRQHEATDPEVIKWAWLVRKQLVFIKMKCRRLEVSIVTRLISCGTVHRSLSVHPATSGSGVPAVMLDTGAFPAGSEELSLNSTRPQRNLDHRPLWTW